MFLGLIEDRTKHRVENWAKPRVFILVRLDTAAALVVPWWYCTLVVVVLMQWWYTTVVVFILVRLDTAAAAHRSSVTISPAVTIATHHLAPYLNILLVFVQDAKCICMNFKMYLSKLQNIFVTIATHHLAPYLNI